MNSIPEAVKLERANHHAILEGSCCKGSLICGSIGISSIQKFLNLTAQKSHPAFTAVGQQ